MSFVKDLERKLLYELSANTKLLDKALKTFVPSFKQCTDIGLKSDYSLEELNAFEALTARFSRITDIITQKWFRTLFQIMGEEAPFFLDKANLAEKLGIVDKADDLIAMRQLRNTIAHEYVISDLNEMFEDVLKYSETLLSIIESGKNLIESKGFNR